MNTKREKESQVSRGIPFLFSDKSTCELVPANKAVGCCCHHVVPTTMDLSL